MTKRKASAGDEPSAAAGGLVLVALVAIATAGLFAASAAAGVLTVWLVSTLLLRWAARRGVSDSSATPPPTSVPLSKGEEAGQASAPRTRTVRREGMLIIHDLSEKHRYHVVRGEVSDK
ncbi:MULTISPECIES: hypothetical protein [unclassified Streptomyces]|uniref:hypothetical protein n=1 Tax=unclassified Streptomyces TaxID=2593676 RepID=UPI00036001BC|nr:hypothetical protein [Streptomyces sp. LaPpAH-202]MYW61331.1 hypothetical protein [Streptomyces sp. SID8370]MYW87278.1 hypothetical protein [Streptomyces sp. SID8371]